MFSRSCAPPGGAAEQAGAPGLPACYRGGPTTTSEAMEAVNPSTQHIPTTVILSASSCSVVCGCWCWWWCCGGVSRCLGRVAVGDLGVLPSGLSPRGVSSFCTLGWGSGVTRGEWSAISPVPAPHLFPTSSGAPCALTPRGCDCLPGGLSWCFLSTGSVGL